MNVLNTLYLYTFPWLNIFNIFNIFNNEKKTLQGWIGKKPSLFLWYKFLRDTKLKFDNTAKIALLEFKEIVEIQKTTTHFHNQIIKENTWDEKNLLNQSTLYFYPHEVFQVKIINKQNIKIASPVLHGGKKSCTTKQHLNELIYNLLIQARKQKLMIEEIEVSHTHPSLEVLIADKNQSKFVFNGLSKRDQKTGSELAEFLDFPLRIKAVTPSVNYSMLF